MVQDGFNLHLPSSFSKCLLFVLCGNRFIPLSDVKINNLKYLGKIQRGKKKKMKVMVILLVVFIYILTYFLLIHIHIRMQIFVKIGLYFNIL